MSEARIAGRIGRRAIVLARLLPLAAVAAGCLPPRPSPTAKEPTISPATPTADRRFFPTVPVATPAAPRVESSPIIVKVSEITSVNEWNTLPALVRIQRLQILSYPSIEKFDARKELVLASAQFYCEQTQCKIKPEEMANNVFFVPPTRFIEEVEKDAGRKFTKEEVEDQLRTRPEMVNKKMSHL